MKLCQVIWSELGRCAYEPALRLMSALREVVAGGGPGHVLFLEHPPTITLGYSLRGDEGRSGLRTPEPELLAQGIRVVRVDRGGKATYHGPGQVLCYLVLSLKELRLGVKRYVGKLMNVVLYALQELGVEAALDPAYPGVWVRGAKVAAVGISVRNGVTAHGFAVNVDTDLSGFRHIVPCGIADRPVTSLAELGVKIPERKIIVPTLLKYMKNEFKLELVQNTPEQVRARLKREATS